jgi:hypothetical protein
VILLRRNYVLLTAALLSVVLLPGCTDVTNVAPNDDATYAIGDYLWPNAVAGFDMSSDSTQSQQWTITDSTTTRILHSGAHTVRLRVNGGQADAVGFTAGSLVDLDPNGYFSNADSVSRFVNTPRCVTQLESTGGMYVGTDSGVFVRASGTNVFRFAGLAGSITAIAQNSAKPQVFIGKIDGTLWTGSDNSWSSIPSSGLPSGSIQALAFPADQALYASVRGSHGIYRYSSSSGWSLVDFMQASTVSILQQVNTSSPRVVKAIVVATSNGQIGVLNVDGSPNIDPTNVANVINGFTMGDGGAVLTATSAGILSGDIHANLWTPLTTPVTIASNAIHAWRPQSGSPSLFFSGAGQIFSSSLSGSARGPLAAVPPGDVVALGHFEQNLFALTTSGCFEFLSSTWIEIPGLGYVSYAHEEGPLVLMKSPVRIGSSWNAGTYVTSEDHKSYSIIGRLLGQYDTLRVGDNRYSDVLMIRYAHENQDLTAEAISIPYWVLYFARAKGIVMTEKVKGDSVVSRMILSGSR